MEKLHLEDALEDTPQVCYSRFSTYCL